MGSDPPPAPDYVGQAEAQGASSQQNLASQTWANRPDINTPWGSQTWDSSSSIDPATGMPVTSWTSNINLSPQQQSALDSQMAIQQGRSEGAQTLLGNAVGALQNPMDWNALPEGAGSISAPSTTSFSGDPSVRNLDATQAGPIQMGMDNTAGDWRQTAQNAVWDLQKPMLDQSRADTETQLSNMGLSRGSEAWNREEQRLSDNEHRAQLAAIDSGRNEAGQLFNQDLQSGQFANNAQAQGFTQGIAGMQFENQAQQQEFNNLLTQAQAGNAQAAQELQMKMQAGAFNNTNRQQAITEQQTRRGSVLNELNALLTGQQVQNPNMPNFSQAGKADTTQYLNAAGQQYQAGLDAFGVDQANTASQQQAGMSAAMMALMAFSDQRLKTNIRKLFTLPSGVEICSYSFKGSDHTDVGVIAQQVQKIKPSAVLEGPLGFLMVNYKEALS